MNKAMCGSGPRCAPEATRGVGQIQKLSESAESGPSPKKQNIHSYQQPVNFPM